MQNATRHTVTQLLGELRGGRRQAFDDLFPLVYEELRALAHRQRRKWKGNETLNTTALVHEAYLKLVQQQNARWETEAHFLATAAKAIRHILMNYARDSQAKKRGGEWKRESLRNVEDAKQRLREKAREVGCDDYETKPIDFARLLEKMSNLLHWDTEK